jgi:hypothetical protein
LKSTWQYDYFLKSFKANPPEDCKEPPVVIELKRLIKEKGLSSKNEVTRHLVKQIIVQFCRTLAHRLYIIDEMRLMKIINELCDFYQKSPALADKFYQDLTQKLQPYLASKPSSSTAYAALMQSGSTIFQAPSQSVGIPQDSYSQDRIYLPS